MNNPYAIEKIAVIGAGTMGPGITQALIAGGRTVNVWEPVEETREKARTRIYDGLKPSAEQELASGNPFVPPAVEREPYENNMGTILI